MTTEPIAGGCQCGAVRYRLNGPLTNPHLCHCRMCQKAFGSYFAPLGDVPLTAFEITRHTRDLQGLGLLGTWLLPRLRHAAHFPLREGVNHISVALGSLDHPESASPKGQFGTEARMPWFGEIAALPGKATDEWGAAIPGLIANIKSSNHQHPDHDT